jgi:hypothetical protein
LRGEAVCVAKQFACLQALARRSRLNCLGTRNLDL